MCSIHKEDLKDSSLCNNRKNPFFFCGFKSNETPHLPLSLSFFESLLFQPLFPLYPSQSNLQFSLCLCAMQTLPSSETLLLASNSPPDGDDVDIDFGDVFGGPPKRRSKVNNEVTRHSFCESALRRRDVIVDVGALIPQDEKPVFGEETSARRRFTTDDFFDDIFRVNESSSLSSSPMMKKEREPFGSSLPGSRILSPALKPESSGTSFPAQFRSVLNTNFNERLVS